MRLRRPVPIVALVVLLAGCSATAAPSPSIPEPRPTSPPSPSPSLRPSPSPFPSPTPGAVAFSSPAYRYDAAFPGDLVVGDVVAASEPWDGAAQIDSDGPRTDHVRVADSRLLFVYGAPTRLAAGDWATTGQQQKASWHGCPPVPDAQVDVRVDGTPALLYDFPCGGLHLQSVYVVHDGFGLVVNLMSPPGSPDADRAAMLALLATIRWQG